MRLDTTDVTGRGDPTPVASMAFLRWVQLAAVLFASGCGPNGSPLPSSPQAVTATTGRPKASVKGSATQSVAKVADFAPVIAAFKKSVRACYQTALDAGDEREGSIELRFSIGERGEVTRLATRARNLSADTEACVRAAMQAVSFTPPENGGVAEAQATFAFSAKRE